MDGVSEERKEGEMSERRESTRGWEEGIAGKEEEKRKSERDSHTFQKSFIHTDCHSIGRHTQTQIYKYERNKQESKGK